MKKKNLPLSLSLLAQGESLAMENIFEQYLDRLGYKEKTAALKIQRFLSERLPASLFGKIISLKKIEKNLYLQVFSSPAKQEIILLNEQIKQKIKEELSIEIEKIGFM